MESLEERLRRCRKVEAWVKEALLNRHFNPREFYRIMPKFESMCAGSVAYMEFLRFKDCHAFTKELYSLFKDRDLLRFIYYGALSLGRLPAEFTDSLTNWEKVYFVRGRWKIRNPDLSSNFERLVIEHMWQGIQEFFKDYWGRYRNIPGANLFLPENKSIRKAYQSITGNTTYSEQGLPEIPERSMRGAVQCRLF